MDASLVGYWRMDDDAANTTVKDETGVNNGTFNDATGDPNTDAHSVAGQVGKALNFDGVDDYVNCGTNVAFDLLDFTAEAWVYIDTTTNLSHRRSVSRDNYLQGGTRKWFALRSSCGTDNVPNFTVGISTSNTAQSPEALTTGWHHLVGIRDEGNYLKLFVDGVEKDSVYDPTSGAIDSGGEPVTIGGLLPAGYERFIGLIDDVRIYNRALSAEEIRRHFSRGRGGTGPFITSFRE